MEAVHPVTTHNLLPPFSSKAVPGFPPNHHSRLRSLYEIYPTLLSSIKIPPLDSHHLSATASIASPLSATASIASPLSATASIASALELLIALGQELEMKPRRLCELCKGEAAVYCEPDSAFLCWACDAAVHGANFLVARHVRRVSCAECWSLDAGRLISGAGSPPIHHICRSCDPDLASSPSLSSSTSSSCLSSAESSVAPAREEEKKLRRQPSGRRRRMREEVDERAEGILASWSRRMGLTGGQRCVGAAVHVLGACPRVVAALPFRVALAAALWFAAKLGKVAEGTGGAALEAVLRRLEACSGVPAKLIVLAEARLARAAGRTRVAEEGWAECS